MNSCYIPTVSFASTVLQSRGRRATCQTAVRTGPDLGSGDDDLEGAYVGLNRLEDARALMNTALQGKLGTDPHGCLFWIAIVEGYKAIGEREATLIKGDTGHGVRKS